MAGYSRVIHVGLSIIFSVISVSYTNPGGVGLTISDSQKQAINDFVQDLRECYSVPGLSMAIVGKDDGGQRWRYTASFGQADMVRDVQMTDKTLLNIGSTTKAMTATLLAILLEESSGTYAWDTPVRDILGDTFYLRDEYMTKETTLVDLLSHRVGLSRHDKLWLLGFVKDKEEMFNRLHLMEPQKPFRTSFLYNNWMYAVAGVVAEKIGGKPWEELIQEKIFDPLGMESSSFINKLGPDYDGLARTHYWMNNGSLEQPDMSLYKNIGPIGPAGSIVSNAEDMAKWLLSLLNDGRNEHGQSLLSPGALHFTFEGKVVTGMDLAFVLARQPQYPVTESIDKYGLGWGSGQYRGFGSLQHGGSLMGYESLVTLQVAPRLGIYSSMNGPMTEICLVAQKLLHMYIIDVIMQREPWLTGESVCTYPQPWDQTQYRRFPGPAFSIVKTIQPERDFEEYVGSYGNYLYGELRVWLNVSEGRLEASSTSADCHIAMYPTGQDDMFTWHLIGVASFFDFQDSFGTDPLLVPTLKFTADDTNGKIIYIKLTLPEAVVFERDLNVAKVPDPDFVEKKCEPSASTCLKAQTPPRLAFIAVFNLALLTRLYIL